MLPHLGPGFESRLRACAAGMLLAAVLGAGMALAGTAFGAGQEDLPPPTEETAPPARTSPPPTPDDPPEPEATTITLHVPAAPAAKAKRGPAKQASAAVSAPSATEERAAPRAVARTRERDRSEPTTSYEEPAAPQAAPKPKPTRKPRKPARRAKQAPAVAAEPVTLWYAAAVRDSTREAAVLGEQFPPQAAAEPVSDRDVYLLILLVFVVVCIVVAWATVNLLGEPPPG